LRHRQKGLVLRNVLETQQRMSRRKGKRMIQRRRRRIWSDFWIWKARTQWQPRGMKFKDGRS
jgi:hypothetical protein